VQIQLNGEPRALEPALTIRALVEQLGLNPDGVAVAINLQIVPRGEHANHILRDGDRVEIIRAVGGG